MALSSGADSALEYDFGEIGSDPFAWMLKKLGLLGPRGFRRIAWPLLFAAFYFGMNDYLLPILLRRFDSKPGYIGPFDPKFLPNRADDLIFAPLLVYYYGQVSLAIPSLFARLAKNGVFGPLQDVSAAIDEAKNGKGPIVRQWRTFRTIAESIWLTPVAVSAAAVVTVFVGFDYISPPGPRSFINSDPSIFAFNELLWFIELYMIAAIFMRYITLTFWLLSLLRQSGLQVDVFCSDNRMGFTPITQCAVLAAKVLAIGLLFLTFVLKGASNIGAPFNGPEWLFYLSLVIVSLPFAVGPIYIGHLLMQRQQEATKEKLISIIGYPHTTDIMNNWPRQDDGQRQKWLLGQVAFIRLAQVKDWPVTVDEAATVIFSYLLGATFTTLSTVKNVLDFIFR